MFTFSSITSELEISLKDLQVFCKAWRSSVVPRKERQAATTSLGNFLMRSEVCFFFLCSCCAEDLLRATGIDPVHEDGDDGDD